GIAKVDRQELFGISDHRQMPAVLQRVTMGSLTFALCSPYNLHCSCVLSRVLTPPTSSMFPELALPNPSGAAAAAAAVPAAEAQHEASADVTHGRARHDGKLADALFPEDRLAGAAGAARAFADALQLREVADSVVALAAHRTQRRGLVLQEPVAEDAAA